MTEILNDYEIVEATTGIRYDPEKQALWYGATERDRQVARAQRDKSDQAWAERERRLVEALKDLVKPPDGPTMECVADFSFMPCTCGWHTAMDTAADILAEYEKEVQDG